MDLVELYIVLLYCPCASTSHMDPRDFKPVLLSCFLFLPLNALVSAAWLRSSSQIENRATSICYPETQLCLLFA